MPKRHAAGVPTWRDGNQSGVDSHTPLAAAASSVDASRTMNGCTPSPNGKRIAPVFSMPSAIVSVAPSSA